MTCLYPDLMSLYRCEAAVPDLHKHLNNKHFMQMPPLYPFVFKLEEVKQSFVAQSTYRCGTRTSVLGASRTNHYASTAAFAIKFNS